MTVPPGRPTFYKNAAGSLLPCRIALECSRCCCQLLRRRSHKWIREQVEVRLGLFELYRELPCLNIETTEVEAKPTLQTLAERWIALQL